MALIRIYEVHVSEMVGNNETPNAIVKRLHATDIVAAYTRFVGVVTLTSSQNIAEIRLLTTLSPEFNP